MSVRAVAKSTRITERYLHALERGDLEALPGGAFDRGYIKSHAQFLDIDPRHRSSNRTASRSASAVAVPPEHERPRAAQDE